MGLGAGTHQSGSTIRAASSTSRSRPLILPPPLTPPPPPTIHLPPSLTGHQRLPPPAQRQEAGVMEQGGRPPGPLHGRFMGERVQDEERGRECVGVGGRATAGRAAGVMEQGGRSRTELRREGEGKRERDCVCVCVFPLSPLSSTLSPTLSSPLSGRLRCWCATASC